MPAGVSVATVGEDIEQLLKQGYRFNQEDVDKIERLSQILGRCHEMVNKIEQFISMRGDIHQMADVTNQLLNFVDTSKSNFSTLQTHFKRFQDDAQSKQA